MRGLDVADSLPILEIDSTYKYKLGDIIHLDKKYDFYQKTCCEQYTIYINSHKSLMISMYYKLVGDFHNNSEPDKILEFVTVFNSWLILKRCWMIHYSTKGDTLWNLNINHHEYDKVLDAFEHRIFLHFMRRKKLERILK
jgi:hypothetical protein